MKHLIQNKQNTTRKRNGILKVHLPTYHSNELFAPQMLTSLNYIPQFNTKPVASQSLHCRKLLPFAPQLTLSNSAVNPYLTTQFASPMPSKNANSQFVPNNLKANNSHSINNFTAKALQKSDNKECEQFEQVNPIQPIIGIKSSNQHKYVKLGANVKIPEYKYSPQKHKSLFAQNSLRIKSNQNNSANSITKMPRLKTNKATPTRARVTFSDTTPSTPTTNTSSNTEATPFGSLLDAAEDLSFTDTLNKVFSRKLLAILNGKDAILKEVRDCVLKDYPTD